MQVVLTALKLLPLGAVLIMLAQLALSPHGHFAGLPLAPLEFGGIGPAVTLDGDLRYVSALPNPAVPAYAELNLRLGWNVTPRLQISVTGANLLHDRHLEFPAPAAYAVPRSAFIELRWRP